MWLPLPLCQPFQDHPRSRRYLEKVNNRLEKTESELAISKTANANLVVHIDKLEKRLVENERVTSNNAQYLRRRQLEINTSDSSLKNGDNLKTSVATLLSKTGTNVSAFDLDKCHTLGKKGVVIMELSTREQRDSILRNWKHLKDIRDPTYGNIYISESLCDSYKRLDFVCRKLKKSHDADSYWFFNGRLWIKLHSASEKVQISHIEDLYNLYSKETIDAHLTR